MHEIIKIHYDICGFTTQKVINSGILNAYSHVVKPITVSNIKYLDLIPYYIMCS